MPITNFNQLIETARQRGPKIISISGAEDPDILRAACEAQSHGLVRPLLIGDRDKLAALAAEQSLALDNFTILHEPSPQTAVRRSVEAVSQGDAHLMMVGRGNVAEVMRTVLDPKIGLQSGKWLSYVSAFEIPGFDRLIFVSDAGVTIQPTLEQKITIVQNAIDVAHRLDITEPKVALVAALEMVNSDMPATVDAANLSKMADRGQIRGGLVDGPLGLDNAISEEAARIKGVRGPVAGKADILITPDIESGNMLVMALSYLTGARNAGVVVGGRAPVVLASREDVANAYVASVALGVMMV